MAEIAFDSIASELLWMGIKPKQAHNLASTLYPNEELILNETNIEDWIENIINLDFLKFTVFCPNENFTNYDDAIAKIKKSNNICKTNIYIDGSNLVKSFKYLNEDIKVENNVNIRKISIKKENYKNYKEIAGNYILHYLAWCILSAKSNARDNVFVENIFFVMCPTDKDAMDYMYIIKDKFGFEIITAEKNGEGYGSCSNEDFILKNKINFDLENDLFDMAIICTGDANNKDGESFISIANKIKSKNKDVQFTSFGLSTSKKIKNNFIFFDLSDKILLPKYGSTEIIIKDDDY